jgi:hypothetical protein
MWYSGMIWTFLSYMKNLGLISKIKTQIACSSLIWKFLPKPYLVFWAQTFTYMLLISALSFVKSCWPLLRKLSCPKIKITYTHIHKLFLHWKYAKTCILSTKNSAPTLGVDKKMFVKKYSMFYKIVISLNICLRDMGYAEVWKRKKK